MQSRSGMQTQASARSRQRAFNWICHFLWPGQKTCKSLHTGPLAISGSRILPRTILQDKGEICLFSKAAQSDFEKLDWVIPSYSTRYYEAPDGWVTRLDQSIGYGVRKKRDWIMYNGWNILWLPSEYRPASSAIFGAKLAIGCNSGRVLIFGFREDAAAGVKIDASVVA